MPPRTERQQVQHLLRRAGFGAAPPELEEYVRLGTRGAVERLLAPEQVDDSATDAALSAFHLDDLAKDRPALFAGWAQRLLLTRRPLLERLTYFWHDHFAASIRKVGSADLMQRQNDLLRQHALGPFHDLLLAVTRDPAMLIYLDNRSNTRTAPNENYAREVMELHTMGSGYTEHDIKEAARALTGWRIRDQREAVFVPAAHDSGIKTVLGETGRWDEADLVRILAARPETARHLATSLWRFFAMPEPDAALVEQTARIYQANGGSIRAMVRDILLSDAFYSDAAYRARIKAPVDYVVSAARTLGYVPSALQLVDQMRRIGQTLYDPPSPAGWPGEEHGAAWINSGAMLARANYAALVTQNGRGGADIPALLDRYGVAAMRTAGDVVDWALDLLVGGDVDEPSRQVLIDHLGGVHYSYAQARTDGTLRGVIYLVLTMPLAHVA